MAALWPGFLGCLCVDWSVKACVHHDHFGNLGMESLLLGLQADADGQMMGVIGGGWGWE